MTSELIELLQDARFRLENMGSTDDTDADLIERIMKHVEILRTRAVPDVPELVRYDLTYSMPFGEDADISEDVDGDYVRYDQVAAMLAALKTELYSMQKERDRALEWRDHDRERALAAEAKLAEYEKQEPIGVIHQGVFYSTKDLEEYPEYSTGIKTYTSPAPMESEK